MLYVVDNMWVNSSLCWSHCQSTFSRCASLDIYYHYYVSQCTTLTFTTDMFVNITVLFFFAEISFYVDYFSCSYWSE